MYTGDAQAIYQLMTEYCFTIDDGALQACSELFAQGSWGMAGDMAEGAAAVMAVLDNVILYDGSPGTKHVMSNVSITLNNQAPGSASARCYITVMQAVPSLLPLQPIFCGSYQDEFLCENGEWYFKSRVISPDLVGDLSHHHADWVQ